MTTKRKNPELEGRKEENNQQSDIKYQAYLDERKVLAAGEDHSADQLDKNILTLAGGALGISLVFLEKIAPAPLPKTLVYLYLAWIGLVLSLLVMLSSFLTSQHAHRRQIRILEAELYSENKVASVRKNRWALVTRCLNWFSIIAFVFGVSMLLYFSVANMQKSPPITPPIKVQPTN